MWIFSCRSSSERRITGSYSVNQRVNLISDVRGSHLILLLTTSVTTSQKTDKIHNLIIHSYSLPAESTHVNSFCLKWFSQCCNRQAKSTEGINTNSCSSVWELSALRLTILQSVNHNQLGHSEGFLQPRLCSPAAAAAAMCICVPMRPEGWRKWKLNHNTWASDSRPSALYIKGDILHFVDMVFLRKKKTFPCKLCHAAVSASSGNTRILFQHIKTNMW